MSITYTNTHDFTPEALRKLFLSVEWSSGHYPDKLATAMKNSGTVYSAWDGESLVGLINALDDGVMTAYVHYLLVDPAYQGKGIGRELLKRIKEKYTEYLRIVLIAYEKETTFYEHFGFESQNGKMPMCITSLWT